MIYQKELFHCIQYYIFTSFIEICTVYYLEIRVFSSQLEQLSSVFFFPIFLFYFFFFHAKGWPIYKTSIVLFSGWPWERLIMRVNDFIAFETGLQARGSASKRGRNYRSSRQRRSTDPGRDKSS